MHCIVHIGTNKTGSTSLQAALAENRDALRQQGFCYPKTGTLPTQRWRKHAGLRFALAPHMPAHPSKLTRTLGIDDETQRQHYRERLIDGLLKEIHAAPAPHTVILSDEDYVNAAGRRPVNQLLEFLLEHFDRVTVIVYVRKLRPFLRSYYSQKIKQGYVQNFEGCVRDFFERPRLSKRLQLWERNDPNYQLLVNRYSAQDLAGGDIVQDFCSRFQIELATARPYRVNRSLSLSGLQWLRRINAWCAPALPPDWLRKVVIYLLRGDNRALLAQLPAELLQQIDTEQQQLEHFIASNEESS